jgi:HupE / UreJ protein
MRASIGMNSVSAAPRGTRARPAAVLIGAVLAALAAGVVLAHGIQGADQDFLLRNTGPNIGPYIYLGAKHMVTGYDHLLFLAGVIFFLYRLRDVAIYVTLFAVGHSTTLLLGVLGGFHVNSYIVDAIIGFSVVYKAFENLGGFKRLGFEPNTKGAVLVFGFFHGFGLATKLQDLAISPDGLVTNMISFNVGVEIGQFIALALILMAFNLWRAKGQFLQHAFLSNAALMCAGFVLIGYQMTGYFVA